MSCHKLYASGGRLLAGRLSTTLHSQSALALRTSAQRHFNTQYVPPGRSTGQLIAYSIGVGTVVGVGYAGFQALTRPQPDSRTQTQDAFFVDRLPDVPITRRLQSARDKTDLDLVLFQYQTCPFCCKVRAFLDSQGLSYAVVEVDAVLRQSIKWSPYKKVPMLLAKCKDGRYVQLTESSMIISILASVLADPTQDVAELYKFYPTETFVDESGASKSEVLNKYFVMLQDQKAATGKAKEEME